VTIPKEKPKRKRKGRRRLWWLLLLTPVVFLLLCWFGIALSSGGRCFDDVNRVPGNDVALVLGTSPHGLFYHYRIEAAVELYKAGKVKYLLVSGDNGSHTYDEPTAMRRDLIRQGVPKEKIYCDYAGFRTLDSIVRAKKVFGQKRFTIVSQRFHNERAIFIAERQGIEAVAFDAEDAPDTRVTLYRECLARAQAVLDVTILNRRPKFLGEPVSIGDAKAKASL